ncbi:MAG: hypothetical protein AAFY63_04375 [Cyanobacteria bacterium J06643_13]
MSVWDLIIAAIKSIIFGLIIYCARRL